MNKQKLSAQTTTKHRSNRTFQFKIHLKLLKSQNLIIIIRNWTLKKRIDVALSICDGSFVP